MGIKNKDKLRTEDLIIYTRLCRKLKVISRNTTSAIINSWKCKHPCFICKWKKFCKFDRDFNALIEK